MATLGSLEPSAEYVVTVNMPGFREAKNERVLVRAGYTASVEIALWVSGITEEVTVTAITPLVDTTTALTGEDITLQLTESLLVRGRELESSKENIANRKEEIDVRSRVHVMNVVMAVQKVEPSLPFYPSVCWVVDRIVNPYEQVANEQACQDYKAGKDLVPRDEPGGYESNFRQGALQNLPRSRAPLLAHK